MRTRYYHRSSTAEVGNIINCYLQHIAQSAADISGGKDVLSTILKKAVSTSRKHSRDQTCFQ